MNNRKLFLIAALIAVVILAVLVFGNRPVNQQQASLTPPPPSSRSDADTTSAIQGELQEIDTGDLEAELKMVDDDINSL